MLFVVFLVIGVFTASSQRRIEHRVLAEQTDRMAVPYVAVIHATPIERRFRSGSARQYSIRTSNSPIYARTNGYLKKWYKDIGSHVHKGDLLAEIDTPEVDAATRPGPRRSGHCASQRQACRHHRAALPGPAEERCRLQAGCGQLQRRLRRQASHGAVRRRPTCKRLEDLESFKRVYAPFSGVITKRNVDIGTLINAGNGGTSTQGDVRPGADRSAPRLRGRSADLRHSIHVDMKACLELTEFPGRNFCGKVVRTADAIDPSTRTLLTEVDVPNPSKTLLQGEYAQVHFDAKVSGEHLSVPNNALLFRPDGTMAAVVGPDNKIDLKKLTIGRDLGTSVEVLGGITSKDAFVINPPDSLEQGEQVKISPASASKGS